MLTEQSAQLPFAHAKPCRQAVDVGLVELAAPLDATLVDLVRAETVGCTHVAAPRAHLARLELAPAEEAAMLAQLNGFFAIVEQMGAVDTSGVEPLYTPLAAVQSAALRLRDDEVTEGDERAANQASAPAVEDGLYLVPKVIE